MEVVPVVVGALGAVNKSVDTWLGKLGITINKGLLQKTALLGTARILRKVYRKVEGRELTQGTFCHWLRLAPLV